MGIKPKAILLFIIALFLSWNCVYAWDPDYDRDRKIDIESGGTDETTQTTEADKTAARSALDLVKYEELSSCASIEEGICLNTTDHYYYYWDGDSVELLGSAASVEDVAFSSAWNSDVDGTSKNTIYDQWHLFDSNDDGDFTDESWFTTALSGLESYLTDSTLRTFGSGDTSPDMSNGGTGISDHLWQFHPSTSPTIIDFDDGDGDHSEFSDGDWFVVLANYTAVIDFSSNPNIEGNANVDFTGSATQVIPLLFVFEGTQWKCQNLVSGMSTPTTLAVAGVETGTLEISELDDTSDPYLLVTTELQTHFISNSESAGADEWDFPAQAEGWDFCFIKEADYDVTLDPNGTEQWYFRNDNSAYTQLSAGEAIENTTSGRSIICCLSTESDVFCTGDANWDEETP